MEKILEYGINLLEEDPSIRQNRLIFKFDLSQSIPEIVKQYHLDGFEMKKVERESSTDFEMGWHQDDVSFHRNSRIHCEKYGKKEIKPYCKEQPPIYTMILYYSSIDTDFTGGEFCFVDQKIRPMSGMGILFDSREIHKVLRVRSGKRRVILLKFYGKNDGEMV